MPACAAVSYKLSRRRSREHHKPDRAEQGRDFRKLLHRMTSWIHRKSLPLPSFWHGRHARHGVEADKKDLVRALKRRLLRPG